MPCSSCMGTCESIVFEVCDLCGTRLGCCPDCSAIIEKEVGHMCAEMMKLRSSIECSQGIQEFFDFPDCANTIDFLRTYGILNKGIWKRVIPGTGEWGTVKFDWCLPDGLVGMVANLNEKPISGHVESWREYYESCNIPATSPIAMYTTWPLTLYHCLKKFFDPQKEFSIHMVGAEIELELIPLFQ
eukprot:UN25456